MSERVYRNADDTLRFAVRNGYGARGKEYDVHTFRADGSFESYSEGAGELFYAMREAVAWLRERHPGLTRIEPSTTITEGMNAAAPHTTDSATDPKKETAR